MNEHQSVNKTRREARKKQAETGESLGAQANNVEQDQGRSFKNQKHVDIMSFNAGAEQRFVEIVRKLVDLSASRQGLPPGTGAVKISTVVQECAYRLNVSTMTVKRYLTKYSAMTAPLRVFGDAVMLNPDYEDGGSDE